MDMFEIKDKQSRKIVKNQIRFFHEWIYTIEIFKENMKEGTLFTVIKLPHQKNDFIQSSL